MNINKDKNSHYDTDSTILVFDTSTPLLCLGLWYNNSLHLLDTKYPQNPHADVILHRIEELLLKHDLATSDLDYIGVGIGPGSFIGVRTTVTVAQGLCYGLNIPVVAVSTLQVIAQNAYNKHYFNKVVVAIDARLDEMYVAQYAINQFNYMELQESEKLYTINNLNIQHADYIIIGNAVTKYNLNEKYPDHIFNAEITVDEQALCDLVRYKIAKDELLNCYQLEPLYVRHKVAEVS